MTPPAPRGLDRRFARRGVVPAIGKALEATLVVLFVSLLTATLFGGLVPDYRAAAGNELADRTLSTAAHRVQDAVGPNATRSSARLRVDLPKTIRGRDYRIRTDGRTLVLAHPDPEIGSRTRLALPDHVVRVEGRWHSRRRTRVRVVPVDDGVVVRLVSSEGGRS